MRLVSRTHRVALDWSFDRNNLEPKIQIDYIDTKTNSLTFWPKEVSREMSGITFCDCSILWIFRCVLAAILATFFPTILIRSTPCRKEVRRRLRMRALQRRKQSHVWCCASVSKGVRTSRHKVWDLGSIQGITMKEKGSDKHQETGCSATQIQKSDILKRIEKIILLKPAGNWGWRIKTEPKVMKENFLTPRAQGNLQLHHLNWKTWDTRTMDTWVRSFNVWRRSWDCLQPTQQSQWTHTKPMYWYGECFWPRIGQVQYLHSLPEGPTLRSRALCRRRIGEAVPRAERFGDLITAGHKVLNEGGESRNNNRYAVVVQDLTTQRNQSFPWKTKTSQETEESLSKLLEPSHRPIVEHTDNSMEFGNTCEDLSWNRRTSTPHRSETNEIAERAVRRVKEGTTAKLLQSGLDEKWWAGSMECYCYPRNVQDLLADGKTPCERRFGEARKVQQFLLEQWLNTIQFLHETSPGSTNSARHFYLEYSSDMRLSRGEIWKGDILVADIEELEKMDASEIYPRRIKRSVNTTKRRTLHIPSCRTHSQIFRTRPRIPRTHSKAGTACRACREWRSQCSTLCAERRIIPYSTEIHWCSQGFSHKSGCVARKNVSTIIGMWTRIEVYQILETIPKVHIIERETSKRIHVVREEIDEHSSNYQTWECVAWSMDQNWKSRSKREKQEWAIEKPKLNNARRLRGIYFIDPEDGENKETIKNARRKLEVSMDAAMPCKKGRKKQCSPQEARSCASNKIHQTKHACIVEAHESTRQRLESPPPKDHEDHIECRGFNSMTHYNLVHKFVPMPQGMKIPDARAAVGKDWKMYKQLTPYQHTLRKNGGCCQIAPNSKVRMSRHIDTSSTTSMAQIMGWHWRSSCTVTHLQASCGQDSSRNFLLELGWEEVPNWECLFVHREQGLFLSVYVDDIQMAGKKQFISWSRKLGMHSTWM